MTKHTIWTSDKGGLELEKDQLILFINGEELSRTGIEYSCGECLLADFLRLFFEEKQGGYVIGADDFYTRVEVNDCDICPSMGLTDRIYDAFLALGLSEEITEFKPSEFKESPLESARLTALFDAVKGEEKQN